MKRPSFPQYLLLVLLLGVVALTTRSNAGSMPSEQKPSTLVGKPQVVKGPYIGDLRPPHIERPCPNLPNCGATTSNIPDGHIPRPLPEPHAKKPFGPYQKPPYKP
ncbi:hypothetical protein COCNU_09G008550 [Cocos nucifera]|uniref:Uncharacterized protein n=1 Tax=Cocos nucifera TaxID=13894 RepID=A0A8K0IKK0_COCNU|nr:hypothetical protein COCNU_09G008550 [Cocos nucifera]